MTDEKKLNSNNNKRVGVEFISGSLSGAVTRFFVAPLDVVKIRFQLQNTTKTGNKLYTGVFQALTKVTKEEGFRALWKGNLSAELLWISYAAVQFSTYTQILALIDKNYRGGHSFLFNGITSSFLQIVPQMAFQFTFYESFKYILVNYSNDKNQALKNPFNQFFCGLLSGAFSKFLVLPFDVVKKRLQVSNKAKYSIIQCMSDLYKNEGGIKSLFKGGVPSIMKAGLAAALSFTFFEQSKLFFLKIFK
ncbi:hypothetical protein DICPUDRAFT_41871 [Dictyostelium purpureum]|uniref:Mitochondrial substrate carrier family protein n=1 Tax=Dictyostelium purpureum TaxID=5786 RepID=F1A0Z0_DICPU|nr:uncharacterized protein DICPUDRAFT_41871 [Dictyostelium purpureum]EGC30145.1 hypothetical protein DICPUDRAFT_41871 [Dictyostelium purpureum]|eukprot:XP_003293328.1 hypothetical protein DICPUDRAFT_41871 [Dictyostelium purpureum]